MKIAGLKDKHFENPKMISILEHVSGYTKAQMIADSSLELSAEQYDQYLLILNKLSDNEPFAYILGFQEFYEHRFSVTKDVLIPRPDTEILVEFAIEYCKNMLQNQTRSKEHHLRILELGTGSGCIAISIEKALQKIISQNTTLEVIATDISLKALMVASNNAKNLLSNVKFIHSDWFNNLSITSSKNTKFDLIVSNPPYIPFHDPHLADLTHEPIIALTDNLDGLSCIVEIAESSYDFLNNDGVIAIEHGYNQNHQVFQILKNSNFKNIKLITDFGGNPRVSYGVKNL